MVKNKLNWGNNKRKNKISFLAIIISKILYIQDQKNF